jgi:hypothetical protein
VACRPTAHMMCRATVSAVVPEAEKTRTMASILWKTVGAVGGGRTTESVIRTYAVREKVRVQLPLTFA